MNRREFIKNAGLGVAGLAAAEIAARADVFDSVETPSNAVEISRDATQAQGEARLVAYAKSKNAKPRSLAYIEKETDAQSAKAESGWHEQSALVNGKLQGHISLLKKLETGTYKGAASVNLYEIGQLPKVDLKDEADDTFDGVIAKAMQTNALPKEFHWIAYLPQPDITSFVAKEGVLAQAYATTHLKGAKVLGNTVTPDGIITYSIREGEAPWDSYQNAYTVAEEVRRGVAEFGGTYAKMADAITIDGSTDPLQRISREIYKYIDLVAASEAIEEKNASIKATLSGFNARLATAITTLRKNFHLALDPFDSEMQDIAEKAAAGTYTKDKGDMLRGDIERAYSNISVDIHFNKATR